MGLGFELGLCAGQLGLEFDFAALQRLVCGVKRFLESVDRFVPFHDLAVSGLEELAGLVEFSRMGFVSGLLLFRELLFGLRDFLLRLLEGALPLLDRLEGGLRLQGAFRGRPSSLERLRLPLPDASFAPCKRGLAFRELLRTCFEFRHLGLELGLLPTQLTRLPRPLAESCDFGLETPDFFLLLAERAMGLRELSGELLLPILPLPTGGLRFGLAGFEVARDFRKVLRDSRGSVRLGFERGLRPCDLGFEFEFASLESLVGAPQGRLQPLDLLDPLRIFTVSILEKFARFVELSRMRFLSRLFPFGDFLSCLLQVFLGLLDDPLPLLDCFERVLRLQGPFRGGSRSLRRLGFALPDPSLAARQGGLALPEFLRSCIEFRQLGLELCFPPT